ncbi:tumor necrosis factor receptor superfamily member 10B-like isoform X2 [Polypterus senegalus]|uniref:tumor necrosis factor receptor superfamily member 10B-like isoform X2 n=1 Tax=Polypterus senegalus TaxID=55291 RepID=UPI00196462F4|nr:tumor necrosis factor receptor superfamily member 10B-like isoform X2 [Polypterus senegalus]
MQGLFTYFLLQPVSGSDEAGASDSLKNRTIRGVSCPQNAYQYQGRCCIKCPAGEHVKNNCLSDMTASICEPCTPGVDYTSYENGLEQCRPCTTCRSIDQEEVSQCTVKQNRICQCRKGSFFCNINHPCEVCKRCKKCKEGEIETARCNATADTDCGSPVTKKPNENNGNTDKGSSHGIYLVILLPVIVIVVIPLAIYFWKKKNQQQSTRNTEDDPESASKMLHQDNESKENQEERQNNTNNSFMLRKTQTENEDEDKGIGGSIGTAHSSQNSLPSVCNIPLQNNSESSTGNESSAENFKEEIPDLIPNQEKALEKSLDYFSSVLVRERPKFLRSIGLDDNEIQKAHYRHPKSTDEELHSALLMWLEKNGAKSDINTLLRALYELNQKLTAETITSTLIEKKLYKKVNG